MLLRRRIQLAISENLEERGTCHFMLTGGRGAAHLYRSLLTSMRGSRNFGAISLYFGDERCVSPDHAQSNYGMAMRTLFPDGRLEGVQVHRIEADSMDLEAAADRYAARLPEKIDVLLLSMGEDGHIASLFPHSVALNETRRSVVQVFGPNSAFQRITITPPVIRAAKQVYVLAIGDRKRRKYEEALLDQEDISSIPARLVLDRTWIFDLEENI